jgi:hypothetical protein
MPQDYARRHSTITDTSADMPRWSGFVIGFVFGLFTAFIFYLWMFVPPDPDSNIHQPTADIISSSNLPDKGKYVGEIQWDFYEIFPKSVVPVIEEYAPNGDKVIIEDSYSYALQTGSFQNPADADNLRAKLILTGLQVYIQEFSRDDVTWHRVLVGPIDSKLAMSRTRERLAAVNIESIQLRMNQ